MRYLILMAAAGCVLEQGLHTQRDGNPGVDTPVYGEDNGPHPTTWHIYDNDTPQETYSSPDFVVDHHGDPSLYWYEPSGSHGMIESTNPAADFRNLREYVIAGAGEPTEISGPMSFISESYLETFEYATFTYVLCDFWVPHGDDPSLYRLSSGAVDDGILILLNERFVDYLTLYQSGEWDLSVAPGQTNSIVIILVDDSADDRKLVDLELTRDGTIIN